jgi:hypothetical protein
MWFEGSPPLAREIAMGTLAKKLDRQAAVSLPRV